MLFPSVVFLAVFAPLFLVCYFALPWRNLTFFLFSLGFFYWGEHKYIGVLLAFVAINYLFGLINVSLFAVIFFQIQLYGMLLLQLFFFCANVYGWYAWSRPANDQGDRLAIRWLPRQKLIVTAAISAVAIALLTCFIDPVFAALANAAVSTLNALGANLSLPEPKPDAFPFWDATMTVLSVVAQILMTRKYVENWILWVVVNLISVGVYAAQGVYAMSLEYLILLFIAANGTRLWMIAARRAQCGALA